MTNKPEQLDLDALERLADAATPGPWVQGFQYRLCTIEHNANGSGHGTPACDYRAQEVFEDDGHEIIVPGEVGSREEATKVAGMWDYEAGGICLAQDAAYIAAADPATVKALVQRVWTAEAALVRLAGHFPVVYVCPSCSLTSIDEDGLCVTCGAEAKETPTLEALRNTEASHE